MRQARSNHKTIFCFAYNSDLEHGYAFYCARYDNITWNEFLNLGFMTFKKKLSSIPKDEPLYEIIKSRTIDLSQVKNKDEKKYWAELKKVNEIPAIFLSSKELDNRLKEHLGKGKKVNL